MFFVVPNDLANEFTHMKQLNISNSNSTAVQEKPYISSSSSNYRDIFF